MQLQENPFTSYEFTVEELAAARKLSPLHKAYYQTLLSDAVASRIALQFTPNDINSFLQQEAELKGQIGILNMLLSEGAHTVAKAASSEV